MTLLIPLGLLGLLGIIALIIIYIIKPNYQQKFISTTFVWKMSLKYRKRKIPTSKLRNFLLILCQVLFITVCALILARPSQVIRTQTDRKEVVLILDSSASMRAKSNGEMRFERAVDSLIKKVEDVYSEEGYVSVILADNNPKFLVERKGASFKQDVMAVLNDLKEPTTCSYGVSNINEAVSLCEDVLIDNPSTEISVYTDNYYDYVPKTVKLVNVSKADEWNVSILNAYAELEDNYYSLYIDVASYGRNNEINVIVEITGANAEDSDDSGSTFMYDYMVDCVDSVKHRLVLRNEMSEVMEEETEANSSGDIDKIWSYKSIRISIEEDDSLLEDNNYYIYGGQKELIKVQYASGNPNKFINGVFGSLQKNYADRWDIYLKEVKRGNEPETSGYDIYVFEHEMPSEVPNDGIVFLIDPDSAPSGAGFRVDSVRDFHGMQMPTVPEMSHPALRRIDGNSLTLSRYVKLGNYDAGYDVLMTCDGSPVVLVKNEERSKIVVLSFDLHYSSFPVVIDFPWFMEDIFNYFNPSTVIGNSFEVNEVVTVNARGPVLNVLGNEDKTIDTFPGKLSLDIPGTYEFMQTTDFGKDVTEKIYVRVPAHESNIVVQDESITDPYVVQSQDTFYKDLVMFFALATVLLLMAEWWLHSKEGM